MENSLQLIINEQNVAKENAKQLIEAFGAPFTEAGEILSTYKEIVVEDENQVEMMAKARESRLILKRIRTGVENKRKELKEDALRTGKAIDGVAKYIKDNIQPAEEYLELQEKFAEVKAAERAAELKAERIGKLSAYSDNLSVYNLDSMNEATFKTLLGELKSAHEAKVAAEKAATEALEKERQAELQRQKDMQEENARLKAEAEKKEKELEEERRLEAQRQREIDERREKERRAEAAKQVKIDAEKEKELAAERAKVELERKKREEIEQAQRDKEATEAKAKAEAEQTERDALLAPDKDKLLSFSRALELIRKEKLPAVKTKQAQDVVNLIDEMLIKMKGIIEKKAEEL